MTTWNEVKDDKNFIKILDHGFVGLLDHMGSDSDIANAARTSYAKGTKTVRDDEKLIRYLVKHEHSSPIEMGELKFLIKVPMFVARQLIRHRTCLSGNTKLHFELDNELFETEISKIFNLFTDDNNNSFKEHVKKMKLYYFNEETKEKEICHITDIWQSGEKETYQIILENGYTITMTDNHQCLTDKGWLELKEFVNFEENTFSAKMCVITENNNEFVAIKSVQSKGKEMTYDLTVDNKFHNFIADGFVVHNCNINEVSARYSIMPNEIYIPDLEHIQPQALDNKQGRSGEMDINTKMLVQDSIKNNANKSYQLYEHLIDNVEVSEPTDEYNFGDDYEGIAREIARTVLPVGTYTELVWKQDLRNLLHLIKLRLDPHAQYEIRVMAQAMYDLVEPLFPATVKAFDDYVRNAHKLSSMEFNIVKQLLSVFEVQDKWRDMINKDGLDKFLEDNNMSKREFNDFAKTFGLWNGKSND